VDDKRLLSMGLTDQTLCQWKIDSIMEEENMGMGEGVSEERMKKRSARINMDDESLINELNFCYSDQTTTSSTQQID
jgi:enoyl-[acyl-carrier-protein] reductase (NADH)